MSAKTVVIAAMIAICVVLVGIVLVMTDWGRVADAALNASEGQAGEAVQQSPRAMILLLLLGLGVAIGAFVALVAPVMWALDQLVGLLLGPEVRREPGAPGHSPKPVRAENEQ
ncbi:MAG: hypothetical protein AAFW01_05045 [Pseudomonadota bacterium]